MFGFAEAGASGIVLADQNVEGLKETERKCKTYATHKNFRSIIVAVDVTNADSVQAMVDTVLKEFGRIDYSVNCARVFHLFSTLHKYVALLSLSRIAGRQR